MYVAYIPKFDVLATSNFDVFTTEVDRRYIDVAYMLSTSQPIISTYFQRQNDVRVPAGCGLR